MDRLSLFNVFGAPWFAAIYILLFISLIGCVTPRIRLHIRTMRAQPPSAPKRLERLPESATFSREGTPEEAAAECAELLRGGRWRVRTESEPGGSRTISAEKGYLRETGNLLFHVALTVLLLGVAAGRLWGYTGSVIVQEGDGFCNTVQQFDSFNPGELVTAKDLAPFCVTLGEFTASYDDDGTANTFKADITYSEGLNGAKQHDVLQVNHPLRLEGLRLYLLGHGFSPVFTITDPSGHVFDQVAAPFIPQDSQFASQGAVKLPDAQPTQIGIAGEFFPTAIDTGNGQLVSIWPEATNPEVSIFVYEGDLGMDNGIPQSVYSIDPEQLAIGALKQVGQTNLAKGQTYTLDDGTTIRFDGYRQWASLQVSRDPAQLVVLGAAVAIVIGLLLSIRVRRRRFWLRATPVDDGSGGSRTVVSLGGLSRSDSGAFGDEFAKLAGRLRRSAADRKD
jgi:cytochrome c biogenesis protein